MRKACAKVTAEDILLTFRFVILPNMYAKVLEQEKYRSFLAVLLSGMPYIGSSLLEYVCALIRDDIKKSKSIKKHLVVVECLLTEIRKLDITLVGHLTVFCFHSETLCAALRFLSSSNVPDPFPRQE
jgi:hypothetical protein